MSRKLCRFISMLVKVLRGTCWGPEYCEIRQVESIESALYILYTVGGFKYFHA